MQKRDSSLREVMLRQRISICLEAVQSLWNFVRLHHLRGALTKLNSSNDAKINTL